MTSRENSKPAFEGFYRISHRTRDPAPRSPAGPATEYRGTSLENDFPFLLPESKGDNILEAVQNLLDQAD